MTISDAKAYIERHLNGAPDDEESADMKTKFAQVVDFVKRMEEADAAKVFAEISDLQARGYTVAAPVQQAPEAVAAPTADASTPAV